MVNTYIMRYLSYILESCFIRATPDCNKRNLYVLGFSEFLFTPHITNVDDQISAAIKQLEEEQRRFAEAAGRLIMGIKKGKVECALENIDMGDSRLVEGGPKGLVWMNTPLK